MPNKRNNRSYSRASHKRRFFHFMATHLTSWGEGENERIILDLSNTNVGTAKHQEITEFLMKNNNIAYINLTNVYITKNLLKGIFRAFIDERFSPDIVYISHNRITKEQLKLIEKFSKIQRVTTSFSITPNKLTAEPSIKYDHLFFSYSEFTAVKFAEKLLDSDITEKSPKILQEEQSLKIDLGTDFKPRKPNSYLAAASSLNK